MNIDRRPALAALTVAGLLWGTTVPLSKLALEWLPPGWLTFARFGLAALATRGGQRLVTYLRLAEIKPSSRLPLAPVSGPARRRGARRTRCKVAAGDSPVSRASSTLVRSASSCSALSSCMSTSSSDVVIKQNFIS